MKQVFKRKILTTTKTVNNILRYYYLATDKEKQNGKGWYIDAAYYSYILSQRYGLKYYQVAGIISALSPQVNWQRNKVIAEKFIQGERAGLHNWQQLDKAEQCLTAKKEDIFYILTKHGVKTSYFYNNIINPTKESGTTIDRHTLSTYLYKPKEAKGVPEGDYKMTKNQYQFFSKCNELAAQKVGINSHEMQATTWLTHRRLRGLPNEYNVKSA